MTTKTHEREENYEINKDPQIRSDRAPQCTPLVAMCPLPHFRLLHFRADEQRKQRGRATYKEQGAPAKVRNDEEVGNGGQQISSGVALLQDSGEQAAPFRRDLLHDERCARSPFTAHRNAEKRAHNEKRREVGGQP